MKKLRVLTVLLIIISFLFASNLVMDWGNSKMKPVDTNYVYLSSDSVRVIRVIKIEAKDTAYLFTRSRDLDSNIVLNQNDLDNLAQGDTLEKVIKTNSIIKKWYPLTMYNEDTISWITVQNNKIQEIDQKTKSYSNLGWMFLVFEILPLAFIVFFFLTNLKTDLKNIVKFSILILLFMIGASLLGSFACNFIIGYTGWLFVVLILFLVFLIVGIGEKYWDIKRDFFISIALFIVGAMIMHKSAANACYTGPSDMIVPVWPYIGGVSALFLIYIFLRWLRGESISS